MKQEIESSLDNLLGEYETRQRDAKNKIQEILSQNEQNSMAFLAILETVIKPAMYGFAKKFTEREIQTEVLPDRENLQITMRLFLDGRDVPDDQVPMLIARFDPLTNTLKYHEKEIRLGRGGNQGWHGETTLDEVTEELIQRKLLHLFKKVL